MERIRERVLRDNGGRLPTREEIRARIAKAKAQNHANLRAAMPEISKRFANHPVATDR